jgi:prepilin-type N-terminal cleavage/methylation domain-containing protein
MLPKGLIRRKVKQLRAFTMIEITITLCILGVLTAIAMPQATKLIDRVRVRSAVADIESTFNGARHLAIARSAQAEVDIDASTRSFYVVIGNDTVRKRGVGAEHGVELTPSRGRMIYSANGSGYGAANLSVVVRRSLAVDTVFVSRLGRVRH